MNPLLKRQIRKYFPDNLKDREDISIFFKAISDSYNNMDDQFKMIQRAMELSSNELYEANQKLRKETIQQRALLSKLQLQISTMESLDLRDDENIELDGSNIELDGSNLVDYINEQAEQLVKINKDQERLVKELAAQNQELNDYAHIVSHDLKSPLRNIEALVSWLKEDHKDVIGEEGNAQIALITSHLEKMDALISGILSYSSIDKGEYSEHKIDLNSLVAETKHLLSVPSHIDVTVSALPVITADRFKIQQLFQNLLDNAISNMDKEHGSIEISANKIGKTYQYEIKDNGKGIKPAYFKKIFQVFQKLDNDSKSTGIGLSIVQKVVSFYDGEIWLDSEVGKGTTFYFTLPNT